MAELINNILFVDPNDGDGKKPETEDLSIFVELSVFNRTDDMIKFNSVTNTETYSPKEDNGKNLTRISFVDSSSTTDSKPYLSTLYTEIGSEFSQSNGDLETLGIESIDISFNSSLAPVVNIKFKDIRGRLFEMGKKSPYAFLFRMPYPIFYLTVKGYYGKAVKYALHMTDFNGELDNDTGSFIINCNFIGYTYAFLADILMGYIKAVPYTKIGEKIIDEDKGYVSFLDLKKTITTIQSSVELYKKDDKLKALKSYNELTEKLNGIKNSLIATKNNFTNSGNHGVILPENENVCFLVSKTDKPSLSLYQTEVLDKIEEYNEYASKANSTFILNTKLYETDTNGVFFQNTNYNDIANNDFDEYQLVENKEESSYLDYLGISHFEGPSSNSTIGRFKKSANDLENEFIKSDYEGLRDLIKSVSFSDKFNTEDQLKLDIFDFRLAINEIETALDSIDSVEVSNTEVVYDDFVTKIEEAISDKTVFKFDSSIGTLFKTLCNHVDIFVETMRTVGREVEADINSGKRNITDTTSLPEYKKDHLKAFPDYLSNQGQKHVFVDSWIGSNVKYRNYPEVKFVNDLYQAMLRKGLEERDYIDSLNQKTTGWYPVNPFDSRILNESAVNPWTQISNSNTKIIYKLLLERMVLFLGYSNSNLSDEEIVDMAKIEATQAFNEIETAAIKLSVVSKGIDETKAVVLSNTIMESVKDVYGLGILKSVGAKTTVAKSAVGSNGLAFVEEDVQGSNDYEYVYSGVDLVDSETPNRNFIPISQTTNSLKLTNNPILIAKENETEIPSTVTYGSVMVGDKMVNGEAILKIIDKSEYVTSVLNYPNYSNIIKNSSLSLSNTTSPITNKDEDTIWKKNYIYGGKYKTPEFMNTLNRGGKLTPLSYDFYANDFSITGLRKTTTKYDTFIIENGTYVYNTNVSYLGSSDVKKLKENLNSTGKFRKELKASFVKNKSNPTDEYEFKFSPKFRIGNWEHDLFSSELYYSQTTTEAKAFLFLHTLPFEGIATFGKDLKYTERDLVATQLLNYFNKRAGTVEVPSSWVYFLGGILYRMSETDDIITGLDGIDKDEYLTISTNRGMSFKDPNQTERYSKVSDIIKNLPETVKQQFIDEFIFWVNDISGFGTLQNKLEVFNESALIDDTLRTEQWTSLKYDSKTVPTHLSNNIANNYVVVSNEYLELRGERSTINGISTASADLIDFMTESKVIINGTYRIWDDTTTNTMPLDSNYVDLYMKHFLLKFSALNANVSLDTTPTEQDNVTVFNTANVDDIKLSIYKNLKSFYDKWVVGIESDTEMVITDALYNHFKIIDKTYGDISEDFKISPFGLDRHLSSSNNVSFYNFIATILKDNNFDFHPLPTYVDYSTPREVQKIFEPNRFSEIRKSDGPMFICMYIGERSNRLDITEDDGNNKDDSFTIKGVGTNGIGSDYSSEKSKIPYFLVSYADQNQSIFKKLTLNQKEFTETHEGLQIIDNISNGNRNDSIGQNLFDIYNNRSYSAGIEMMGCAEIQPFMYFQLDNVPMFRGAYTVLNVSHSIRANHMTTNFKGYRIRKASTKMVDNHTLFMNLFTNLEGVNTEGASFRNLTDKSTYVTSESNYIPDANVVISTGAEIEVDNVTTIDPQFRTTRSRDLSAIDTIVLHWTAGASITSDVNTLKSKGYGYHFLIDKSGVIYQGAKLDRVVSHAGESYGPQGKYVNGHSIGISFSMLGTGDDTVFSDNMYAVCAKLITSLKSSISTLKYITGHHWISPGRKIDPYTFDFFKLRSLVGDDFKIWQTEDAPFPSGLTQVGSSWIGPGNHKYSKDALSTEVNDLTVNGDTVTE